jgi:hypothetical protein
MFLVFRGQIKKQGAILVPKLGGLRILNIFTIPIPQYLLILRLLPLQP